MKLSSAERALRERFEATYATCQAPVMRAIERSFCGCDYGATSWTTREEADRIGTLLALGPGVRLLDLGAGTGWPALYLAKTTGCDVTLTDLPVTGLRIAMARTLADREPPIVDFSRAEAVAEPDPIPRPGGGDLRRTRRLAAVQRKIADRQGRLGQRHELIAMIVGRVVEQAVAGNECAGMRERRFTLLPPREEHG